MSAAYRNAEPAFELAAAEAPALKNPQTSHNDVCATRGEFFQK
jgi:hypothetical protein